MSDDNSLNKTIEQLRRDYAGEELREESMGEDPIEQFAIWFEQAMKADVTDVNAMTLATASAQGKPSSRIVLLKGFNGDGFRFFTNYNSRKGREIAENPDVQLCFYWAELARQVRIEGEANKISRDESQRYFNQRPRHSQISAWASNQSEEVSSREKLDEAYREYQEKFSDVDEIPVPEDWGGYIVKPRVIEFWQGRPGRLHDRVVYQHRQDGWETARLAP